MDGGINARVSKSSATPRYRLPAVARLRRNYQAKLSFMLMMVVMVPQLRQHRLVEGLWLRLRLPTWQG